MSSAHIKENYQCTQVYLDQKRSVDIESITTNVSGFARTSWLISKQNAVVFKSNMKTGVLEPR